MESAQLSLLLSSHGHTLRDSCQFTRTWLRATPSPPLPQQPVPAPPSRTEPQQPCRAQAFTHACSDPCPRCSQGEPFKREVGQVTPGCEPFRDFPRLPPGPRLHAPWAWCLPRRVRPSVLATLALSSLNPQAPWPTRLPICCSLRLQGPPDPCLYPPHSSGESKRLSLPRGNSPELPSKISPYYTHLPTHAPPAPHHCNSTSVSDR